jgi:hypothetical protein
MRKSVQDRQWRQPWSGVSQQSLWDIAAPYLLAEARAVGAERRDSLEIETGSSEHQPCEPALRKAEEPNLGRIDHVAVFPTFQHKIDQANHIGRSGGPNRQTVALRGIVAVVARMTDGRDDKAGIGQRLCGVMMDTEPA